MDKLKDDCIVCFEKNLSKIKDGKYNCVRCHTCGSCYCISCEAGMNRTAEETNIKWSCPICRAPEANSAKEDFERALKHALKGRLWALDVCGENYARGYGVTQSHSKAFEFFSLAASQGLASAQYHCGISYRNGLGVDQNHDLAFKFFLESAEQGLSISECAVGTCFEHGLGVSKSIFECYKWYLLSSEKGYMDAQFNLANIYYNGDEKVEKDYEKAFYWYTKAAEQGHKKSQFFVSECYCKGEGTKQSIIKAIFWIRKYLKDNTEDREIAVGKECLEKCLSIVSSVCSGCGSKNTKIPLACGKCISAYYCNRPCQAKHWKNGHKNECMKIE